MKIKFSVQFQSMDQGFNEYGEYRRGDTMSMGMEIDDPLDILTEAMADGLRQSQGIGGKTSQRRISQPRTDGMFDGIADETSRKLTEHVMRDLFKR